MLSCACSTELAEKSGALEAVAMQLLRRQEELKHDPGAKYAMHLADEGECQAHTAVVICLLHTLANTACAHHGGQRVTQGPVQVPAHPVRRDIVSGVRRRMPPSASYKS